MAKYLVEFMARVKLQNGLSVRLDLWFSTGSSVAPQWTFGNAWRHFQLSCLGERITGI